MKKIMISSLLVGMISCQLLAQNKVSFSSKNYFGIVAGSSGTNPQLQTINGFKINKWFAGIGTGIDWYYQRSIPLFFSFDRNILMKQRRNFILSADVGANFPWQNNQYQTIWGFEESKTVPGFYWATGFGYRIGIGKQKDALLLNFGYTNKFFKEKTTNVYPCLVAPCPEHTESFNYNLRAISIKVGYGF